MNNFPKSELILNNDGSVYHLHLLPQDIADTIITVGDPERVDMIAKFFDKILLKKKNREFYTITGIYKSKHISIISTGIGTDNIDIVLNELNVLCKINLNTLEYNSNPRKLNIIRLGTSGTLRQEIPLGSFLISEYALGLEGLMNFYPIKYDTYEREYLHHASSIITKDFEFLHPYIIGSSKELLQSLGNEMLKGTTATCQGFYHPQGRFLWSERNNSILESLSKISFQEKVITNFEMETSAILGLARYFNHEATSISLILANRITNEFIDNAEKKMEELIELCLDNIACMGNEI